MIKKRRATRWKIDLLGEILMMLRIRRMLRMLRMAIMSYHIDDDP